MARPSVSFVVPAKDEGDCIDATLESIVQQAGARVQDVIVVDGGSTDDTVQVARNHGAAVVEQAVGGIGAGRHLGAEHATGDYLAFVDADTVVRETYADRMLEFVRDADVVAASSRCLVPDSWRAKAMEWTINYVFPRLNPPILPGFNTFVERDAYLSWGGFPDVPNEDTAFSRRFGREYDTAYCSDVLVATSGRRFADDGLTGSAAHYVRKDAQRLTADEQ